MYPIHEQGARYLVAELREDAGRRRLLRRIKAFRRSNRRAGIAAARAIHAQSLLH